MIINITFAATADPSRCTTVFNELHHHHTAAIINAPIILPG
jgi:hypothetical protein